MGGTGKGGWSKNELADWHLAKGSSRCGHIQDEGVSFSSWSCNRDGVGAEDRLQGEKGEKSRKKMTKNGHSFTSVSDMHLQYKYWYLLSSSWDNTWRCVGERHALWLKTELRYK